MKYMKSIDSTIFRSLAAGCLLLSSLAVATPSSTYWAPSTANCQAWAVPHITYDNYFGKSAAYPNDVGLTVGFLPWEKIQGEAGFDALYPSQNPLYLNGKLCTPESTLFSNSPALSVGIYDIGTQSDVTNYNVGYVMLQKSLPWGGYVAAGYYHGFNKTLFVNSDGNVSQNGAIAAATSPDIEIGLTGLKKVIFAVDVQTGKKVLGAWGVGSYIYFADNVSLLTVPVLFLDRLLQPGGSNYLWTMQLDIDVPFTKTSGSK